MSTSANKLPIPVAVRFRVSAEFLTAELSDGRTISAPLAWYPRVARATEPERSQWEMIGHGAGIRWPCLDEDISVQGLLAGLPSSESPASFAVWLAGRSPGSKL
jgi:hypothetical protein